MLKTHVESPLIMSIRENPPTFIRTDEQLAYYHQMYDDLAATRTELQYKDRNSLGMLAVNIALFDECMESITEDGWTITYQGDRKEVTKANPAVATLKDAQMAVRHYLKEFGMSPNSRTSIGFSTGGLTGASKDGDQESKINKFNRVKK